MKKLFHWCPEALLNTVVIANRCNVRIPAGDEGIHKPIFPLPTDFHGSHDDYLRKICKAGLHRRYGIDADASGHTAEEQKIIERMDQELSLISSSSLSSDFLVIWDLLWDKKRNDWRCHNLGQGAICGSLVAYLMPVIDIDPLKHNLLFERFLNKERTACLNIDIEECPLSEDVVSLSLQKHNREKYLKIPDNASEAFALLATDDDRLYVANHDPLDAEWDSCWRNGVFTYLRKKHAKEYDALRHLLAKVKPNNLEELTALYALYRPGPLIHLGTYLRRRSGEEPVVYAIPELEPILKDTYGIILYQEQFMQIVHLITGSSLGKADCLRRSMGPRKVKLPISKEEFLDTGRHRGFEEADLLEIWDHLLYSAPYCYLKSHAVARATLLYRVAYFKALAQTWASPIPQ